MADNEVLAWCLDNGLESLRSAAGTKLGDLCGIQKVCELARASSSQLAKMVSACSMNVGEELRFTDAIEKLKNPQTTGESLPKEGFFAQLLPASKAPPHAEATIIRSLRDESCVAFPFDIFDADLDENNLPDIHESVKLGLGSNWDPKVHELMLESVKNHLKESETVKTFISEKKCSLNEVGAVVYYSTDAKIFSGTDDHNIYNIINPLMATRKKHELQNWQPFLYYLCRAEQKLPSLETRIYREMTVPLTEISTQYKPRNELIWTSFTNASTKKDILNSENDQKGVCWLMIDAITAKDISMLSLSGAAEAILFPNTILTVVEVLASATKGSLEIPASLDIIHLRQEPTPKEFNPLHILSQNQNTDEAKLKKLFPLAFTDPKDPESLFQVGQRYSVENPEGIQKDPQKARQYFTMAAGKGHDRAQFNLGAVFFNGEGVPQDRAKAVEMFTLSANQGYVRAQHALGTMYGTGQHVTQNFKKAFDLFTSAADQGHTESQVNLGTMYENGQGTAQDYSKAFKLYLAAAADGSPEGQRCLGTMYNRGLGGAEKNDKKAAEMFILAAAAGETEAQFYLGVMYFKGQGVTKNLEKAVELLTLAASKGHPKALSVLGQT